MTVIIIKSSGEKQILKKVYDINHYYSHGIGMTEQGLTFTYTSPKGYEEELNIDWKDIKSVSIEPARKRNR